MAKKKKQKKEEIINWPFMAKVIRNAVILGAMSFGATIITSNSLDWQTLQPLLLFLVGYITTELSIYYKIKQPRKEQVKTLIF